MNKRKGIFWILALTVFLTGSILASRSEKPIIGDSVGSYTLAPENQNILGMTFDEISKEAPRLFVMDKCGKIFVYGLDKEDADGFKGFSLKETIGLPMGEDGKPINAPRGLAFALENNKPILYFLNWDDSEPDVVSELWRYDFFDKIAKSRNLSFYVFRIGDRELQGLTYLNGKLFVSFDASNYLGNDLRVKRGIIQLEWNQAYDGRLDFVKHMPDAGTFPSGDLTAMVMDEARYLWGTVGDEYIYAAEAAAGRAIFHFDRPRTHKDSGADWELAFGDDYLWVSEHVPGPDVLHRINVTKNLDAAYEGPRQLRHLIMTINTFPEKEIENPGKVYHNYSRPYPNSQMPNQGSWPKTEKVVDVSEAPNGSVKNFTYDPGEDKSSRQYMGRVVYENAPSQQYSSKYEIDIWTNPWRKFVYPHRVNMDQTALAGTNYLADDPELFNLTDTDTYDGFINRIKSFVQERYGIEADLKNPYWAVRNALEYIQDHYYYPGRAKRKPAAVDYDNKHYDANPGNLKIALSDEEYNKSQIIACSGTSVMLSGYMRYLGFPARWLGTGTEHKPDTWDENGNGLLDEGEKAGVSSGHRYTQVWLGSQYGWICFDATPTRPPYNDYDPVPPAQPQWRFINRLARGHLKDKRIVFNVGSGLFRPLYRDFEYDENLAIDNNCGGDQRYNLQGRFDVPLLWKNSRQRIMVQNLCFVKDISLGGEKNATNIIWKAVGQWNLDPDSKLIVLLQKVDPETNKNVNVAVLAKGINPTTGNIQVDLSPYSGQKFRICILKMGDNETGGLSSEFNLE